MTNIFIQIALIAYFAGSMTLQAAIIRVPADQSTIQSAVNSASNGDTVVVYPGTYYENIIFRGKNIVVTSRFYEAGDLNFIQSTIIDGSQPVYSDTASCVLIINHEDSTAVLQGFTITGGKGTRWLDEHGAGTYREGGGILTALSSPTIRYNFIFNNEASSTTGVTSAGGGGIRAGDGNPKILNNVISTNTARYGAGIVLNYTGAIVKNNIITNNSGGESYGGGALWMNHDGSTGKIIENNSIAGNSILGVYIWQGASVIRNCILWGNTSPQIGVRSGGPAVTFSDVQGGWTGTGNIDQNPIFIDTNYCLQTGSPCIDAGDSAVIYNDPEDPQSPGSALWPSQGGIRNDMGAFGGHGSGELPNIAPPTEVIFSKIFNPCKFRLEQNHPNPFNPSTRISFFIETLGFTSLRVYDLFGREVAALVNEIKPAGSYQVEWNAVNMPSGIYFCRLISGSYTETRKLILLK